MTDYAYNIKMCIERYKDFKSAKSWLVRAYKSESFPDFEEILDEYCKLLIGIGQSEEKILSDLHKVPQEVLESTRQHFDKLIAEEKQKKAEKEKRNALIEERRRKDQKLLEEIRQEEARIEKAQKEKERKRLKKEIEENEKKQAIEKKKAPLLRDLENCLKQDFLQYERFYSSHPDKTLISTQDAEKLRNEFLVEWLAGQTTEKLDANQIGAVAHSEGNLLLTARAGSGKTRTLVTKAIFLLKHCGVQPGELLLLSFNRKAAEEMKERIKDTSGELPHVMTFHALGHAVVHPDEDLLFDDADSNALNKSRDLQTVIDELIRSKEHLPVIRDLMIESFTEDWERIEGGRFYLPMKEFIEHRSALPRETLGREYVKSYGEKLIANTLFQYDIDYKYERNHYWNGTNYRPDFTILSGPGTGVIIEYFGMKGDPDYDKESSDKREYWKNRKEWTLLEYTPADILRNGKTVFAAKLIEDLNACGIKSKLLSEEEIWERVKTRGIDDFTNAMTKFIGRCRKSNLGVNVLQELSLEHSAVNQSEKLFIQIGIQVYSSYLKLLKEENKEDFDGLMWRALNKIENGQGKFTRDRGREAGDLARLRFVLIDEFQDFSEIFYRICRSIKAISPSVQFFCVGDDWQAINSFAGSDLSYFKSFNHYFDNSHSLHLSTNYRSANQIVEVGNWLMNDFGRPAEANRVEEGSVNLVDMNEFSPTEIERRKHEGDLITPVLLRLIWDQLKQGNKVTLLVRRNGISGYVHYGKNFINTPPGLPKLLAHLRSFLPEEERRNVDLSTIHKYKGLESKAVIIVDAIKRCYPLIHPHWFFMRIFGVGLDSLYEEERRLFYVALSRPEMSLTLVTNNSERTPFLDDISSYFYLDELDLNDLTPMPSLDGPMVEVRVSNAFEVKGRLQLLGYRFNSRGKSWSRAFPEEGFSWEKLLSQDWAKESVRIDVLNEQGKCIYAKPA